MGVGVAAGIGLAGGVGAGIVGAGDDIELFAGGVVVGVPGVVPVSTDQMSVNARAKPTTQSFALVLIFDTLLIRSAMNARNDGRASRSIVKQFRDRILY